MAENTLKTQQKTGRVTLQNNTCTYKIVFVNVCTCTILYGRMSSETSHKPEFREDKNVRVEEKN